MSGASLSEILAQAVAVAAPSVVRVDDGAYLTASGIIWSADGLIVATSHGIEQDDEISIILSDGTRHAAQLIGRDADTDIAVLRVDGVSDLPAIARHADGSTIKVGHLAVAVAFPGEVGLVATLGLVSRKQETETDGQPEYLLYTDADLYPGMSGGALVGSDGRMIGLLNRMFGRGMGVALGISLIERVVKTLVTHGKMPRGYLGIRTEVVVLPESLRTALALEQQHGMLIGRVETGSAADTAGVLLGDILLAIDNTPIEDVVDLRRTLRAGKETVLRLVRGGSIHSLTLTVGSA